MSCGRVPSPKHPAIVCKVKTFPIRWRLPRADVWVFYVGGFHITTAGLWRDVQIMGAEGVSTANISPPTCGSRKKKLDKIEVQGSSPFATQGYYSSWTDVQTPVYNSARRPPGAKKKKPTCTARGVMSRRCPATASSCNSIAIGLAFAFTFTTVIQ